jgi:hypothetical protein
LLTLFAPALILVPCTLSDMQAAHEEAVLAATRERLRSRLRLWRGLVECRQLLQRVFAGAERAWEAREEAGGALGYGDEFRSLLRALRAWRGRAGEKRGKRRERAEEQAAIAHYEARLAVWAFGSLRRAARGAGRLRELGRLAGERAGRACVGRAWRGWAEEAMGGRRRRERAEAARAR